MDKTRSLGRIAGIVAFLTIVALSTIPGTVRPHVLGSGDLEHFTAYLGTAFLLGYGVSLRSGAVLVATLSTVAAVFEILQIWIPGRSPGFENWMASSLGALAGAVIAAALAGILRRLFVPQIG